MILPTGTVVAVMDGETVRLFRNKGHEPHIELETVAVPKLKVKNTGSGARHRSSAANPDVSRLHEDNVVAAAAAHLNAEALAGRIDHLFVIADPRTLGELRRHYHPALSAKIVGEMTKDLRDQAQDAIEAALRAM